MGFEHDDKYRIPVPPEVTEQVQAATAKRESRYVQPLPSSTAAPPNGFKRELPMAEQLPLPLPSVDDYRGVRDPYELEQSIADVLSALGIEVQSDPNFVETPARVAAYLCDHFRSTEDVQSEIDAMARAVFPSRYRGMISQTGIHTNGMCPHHLLPIDYTISVGYLPHERVIGLSKLARVPMVLTGLPLLQEDYTYEIAQQLSKLLETPDVAVEVRGVHMCMSIRGAKQHDAVTVTASMLGKFEKDEGGCKSEFLSLVSRT